MKTAFRLWMVLALLLVPVAAFGADEICTGGVDEDGDGFIDCDDFDCENDPACAGEFEQNCTDGTDDDGDGFVDCDDWDCDDDPACEGGSGDGEICDNGTDDDGDGFVDCDDEDCATDAGCVEDPGADPGDGADPGSDTDEGSRSTSCATGSAGHPMAILPMLLALIALLGVRRRSLPSS